jgi:hypothetical protein
MMIRDVSLRCVEERLLGVGGEPCPALAIRDSSLLFGHDRHPTSTR